MNSTTGNQIDPEGVNHPEHYKIGRASCRERV